MFLFCGSKCSLSYAQAAGDRVDPDVHHGQRAVRDAPALRRKNRALLLGCRAFCDRDGGW